MGQKSDTSRTLHYIIREVSLFLAHPVHIFKSLLSVECSKIRSPCFFNVVDVVFKRLLLHFYFDLFLRPVEHIWYMQELVVKMLSDKSICNSKRFIEIGCGSGAICISLLKQLPSVRTTVSSVYIF